MKEGQEFFLTLFHFLMEMAGLFSRLTSMSTGVQHHPQHMHDMPPVHPPLSPCHSSKIASAREELQQQIHKNAMEILKISRVLFSIQLFFNQR
jgi:hypothetical protein